MASAVARLAIAAAAGLVCACVQGAEPDAAGSAPNVQQKPVAAAAEPLEGSEPPLAPPDSSPKSTAPGAIAPATKRDSEDEPPLVPESADETSPFKDALRAVGVSGSLRGALWSSNRRVDDETGVGVASLWAKLDKKLNKAWAVFAEGYLAAENLFDHARDTSRLREAYVNLRLGDWDLRVGKQIVAWGRADRINPTDNLTPRDFTLLVPEVDEDRFGSLAAKAAWNLTASMSLTGVWIPVFRPNVFADSSAPGISVEESIPNGRDQWALKLDESGKDIDWSVSYFQGFDLNPDVQLISATPTVTRLRINHNRLKVLGFDAATTRGAYRFAVEGAYTRTEDTSGDDPYVKNPFFFGVFGVERTFGENLTLNVQAFGRQVQHYQSPNEHADPAVRAIAIRQALVNSQYDRATYGMSARIGKKWFNETLEGELAGVVLLSRKGYVIRPKLTYAWSDAIKLIAGFEYYGGSDKTTYGLAEKNRALFLEGRYFF